MLRPAGCQSVSRYFAKSPLQSRPCLAGVRPFCILSVPVTAKQHTVVPPTQPKCLVVLCVGSERRVLSPPGRCMSSAFFRSAPRSPSRQSSPRAPQGCPIPRPSCPSIVGSISRSCFGWFSKVFPCGLWVGLGLLGPTPTTAARTSRQRWPVVTLLSSANTSRQRHLQVPSRHHGEVRVVASHLGSLTLVLERT